MRTAALRHPLAGTGLLPVFALLACAVVAPVQAAPAQPQSAKPSKELLMKLYLASLAADRCGFAITAKQADALEGATNAIQTRLRLNAQATDELYSEADVAFVQYGAEACNRGGTLAKVFGETLADLTKP